MYSCSDWDGLAKIGNFATKNGSFTTPALFPVVDPKLQNIPIQEMKDTFGFDQVITSAYLMSKRLNHKNWQDYPLIHDYLDFDGIVMMDSGAYQIMVYGDIELGVLDTLQIQKNVQPDIGVIMDHPIGYEVSYQEAKQRNENTLANLEASIPHLDKKIAWTLPIQGGRYLPLLQEYLEIVSKEEIIGSFDFYALGSVVPIMIQQDYSTLVNMLSIARKYLPVKRPLHLFGAGHPAMFALATFMGCDTFDSAAYALMAKEDRYMTVDGTYQLNDLNEFPCACQICVTYSPKALKKMDQNKRMEKLSMHNLWVSSAEIRRIRIAIRDGTLWELVNNRAQSVPYLTTGTRKSIEVVTKGELSQKYESGVPISFSSPIRINRKKDLENVEITRVIKLANDYIKGMQPKSLILVAYDLTESIYKKIPDYQINHIKIPDNTLLGLFTPPFGISPLGFSEMYPIGQIINELGIDSFTVSLIEEQLSLFKEQPDVRIISTFEIPQNIRKILKQFTNLKIIKSNNPVSSLLSILE